MIKKNADTLNGKPQGRPQSYQGSSADGLSPRTQQLINRKKKKSKYIKIGSVRVKPRFLVILVLFIVFISLLISLFTGKDHYYSMAASSITLTQETNALVIKDEQAHLIGENDRVVFSVEEGAYVNIDDVEMTYEDIEFNPDWYSQYSIACKNTVEYLKSIITDDVVLSAVEVIESQIDIINKEVVYNISLGNIEKVKSGLSELNTLIDARRDDLVQAAGMAPQLNEYLLKEQQIKDKMKSATHDVLCDFPGIVSYNTDGWGHVITCSSIDYLTAGMYKNIVSDSSAYDSQRAKSAYFVTNPNKFYLAFSGGEMFTYLKEGDEILLRFSPYGEEYFATVSRCEIDGIDNFVIVELTANIPELVKLRTATIYIRKTWQGMVIPQSCIVQKRDQKGVYLLVEKKNVFTPVYILTQDENIIIPDTSILGSYTFKAGDKILKKGK
ncbi:MAG: hypothetical protein E7315_00795 [Clostridiales bacterium]|nr:hypothetical protein [Clostridiales bacterium]